MFGLNTDSVKKKKIDKSTAQVLELEAEKKGLEMEKEQIALDLANMKTRQSMALEKEQHKHELALQAERAVFEREREIWEKEKAELVARAKREKEEFENTLRKELELKHNETVTLTKLESQQKIKQAEIDKERVINKLKAEHAQELARVQADESEKYHEKLDKSLQEIMIKGDHNSKFLKQLTLEAVKKVNTLPKVGVDVDVSTEPKQLASGDKE